MKSNWDVYLSGIFAGTLTLSADKDTAQDEVYDRLAVIGLNCIDGSTNLIELQEEEE